MKLNNRLIFQVTALGIMIMISSITSLNTIAPTLAPAVITEITNPEPQETLSKATPKSITVEEYVSNYFSDIPIMVEVARCESRLRQYDSFGNVLRGEKNSLDRGVMQINEFYHNEDSERLGFDIMTLEGNTAYARYLYEKYGLSPWKSSSKCWMNSGVYNEYQSLAMD